MTSLRDRDAGRDFEGNGPSSFDRRDYSVSDMDLTPRIPGAEKAIADAIAQCERAFGKDNPHHAKWEAIYSGRRAAA